MHTPPPPHQFSEPVLRQVAEITHPAMITRCKPLSWPPPLTHTGSQTAVNTEPQTGRKQTGDFDVISHT